MPVSLWGIKRLFNSQLTVMKNSLTFIIGFGFASVLSLSLLSSTKQRAYNAGYLDGESMSYHKVDSLFFATLENNAAKWQGSEQEDTALETINLIGRDWLGE